MSWTSEQAGYYTPTGNELWNDPEFCRKRIREQKEYIKQISTRHVMGEIDYLRFSYLYSSAIWVQLHFTYRLNFLLGID